MIETGPNAADWMNAGSAFVVAIFAVLQVILVFRQGREAKHAAYNVVWAEWNRIMQVQQQWADEDLIALASNRVLEPTRVLPEDWSLFCSHLAQLGGDAARYGASAHTFLSTAAENARVLNTLVQSSSWDHESSAMSNSLKELEVKIKAALSEGVLLLEDAMAVAPGWITEQRVSFGNPQSQLGIQMKAEFARLDRKRHWWRR